MTVYCDLLMLWNATTGRDHWVVFQSCPNTRFIRLEGKSWCQGQSKTESDQARRNAKGEQRTRTETGSKNLDVEVQCEFRKQELKREGRASKQVLCPTQPSRQMGTA